MGRYTQLGSDYHSIADEWYIRILTATSTTIGTHWNSTDVCDSFWRLYINFRSGAKAILPDSEYPLKPNVVHLIPAWCRFSCFNTRPVRHFFIHFDIMGPMAGVVRDVFDQPIGCNNSQGMVTTARTLVEQFDKGIGNRIVMQCQIKALVYEAMATAVAQLSEGKRKLLSQLLKDRSPVLPAIEHIDAHLHEALSNATLAEMCCYSEDHFIRQFSKCVGTTPAQYVRQRRIAASAQMLLFTDDSIEQIAEQTGFPNRYYFSRVFTKEVGIAPASYRKRGVV